MVGSGRRHHNRNAVGTVAGRHLDSLTVAFITVAGSPHPEVELARGLKEENQEKRQDTV
jgi:hypothetical protein